MGDLRVMDAAQQEFYPCVPYTRTYGFVRTCHVWMRNRPCDRAVVASPNASVSWIYPQIALRSIELFRGSIFVARDAIVDDAEEDLLSQLWGRDLGEEADVRRATASPIDRLNRKETL